MKLRYMSDLHMEFDTKDTLKIKGDPDAILILPGDIHLFRRYMKLQIFLEDLAKEFRAIIFVAGNHEYYGSQIDSTPRIEFPDNCFYLDNSSVTIDDITFVGSTLWTSLDNYNPLTVIESVRTMNDFKVIKEGDSTFSGQYWYDTHKNAVQFIKETLEKNDKCVVVTHHCPSFKSISPAYIGSSINGAYATDLSDLILDTKPLLWFHGHVHTSFDYTIGVTRVLCNPRGYKGYEENPDFDTYATVEL